MIAIFVAILCMFGTVICTNSNISPEDHIQCESMTPDNFKRMLEIQMEKMSLQIRSQVFMSMKNSEERVRNTDADARFEAKIKELKKNMTEFQKKHKNDHWLNFGPDWDADLAMDGKSPWGDICEYDKNVGGDEKTKLNGTSFGDLLKKCKAQGTSEQGPNETIDTETQVEASQNEPRAGPSREHYEEERLRALWLARECDTAPFEGEHLRDYQIEELANTLPYEAGYWEQAQYVALFAAACQLTGLISRDIY